MNLFVRFHRTWAGGDDHFGSADFYAATKIDDRSFGLELPARELERLRDAHHFAHPFEKFEVAVIEIAVYADRAEHGMRSTCRTMHVKTVCDQFVDHVLNLGVRCALLHDNDHGWWRFSFLVSVGSQSSVGEAIKTEVKNPSRRRHRNAWRCVRPSALRQ